MSMFTRGTAHLVNMHTQFCRISQAPRERALKLSLCVAKEEEEEEEEEERFLNQSVWTVFAQGQNLLSVADGSEQESSTHILLPR